ncbi:hypothetical protein HDU92_004584 [Lobulomyces angularis]|nr:hypothetical protein HDU92_004584 [Lobulomyces angularis]
MEVNKLNSLFKDWLIGCKGNELPMLIGISWKKKNSILEKAVENLPIKLLNTSSVYKLKKDGAILYKILSSICYKFDVDPSTYKESLTAILNRNEKKEIKYEQPSKSERVNINNFSPWLITAKTNFNIHKTTLASSSKLNLTTKFKSDYDISFENINLKNQIKIEVTEKLLYREISLNVLNLFYTIVNNSKYKNDNDKLVILIVDIVTLLKSCLKKNENKDTLHSSNFEFQIFEEMLTINHKEIQTNTKIIKFLLSTVPNVENNNYEINTSFEEGKILEEAKENIFLNNLVQKYFSKAKLKSIKEDEPVLGAVLILNQAEDPQNDALNESKHVRELKKKKKKGGVIEFIIKNQEEVLSNHKNSKGVGKHENCIKSEFDFIIENFLIDLNELNNSIILKKVLVFSNFDNFGEKVLSSAVGKVFVEKFLHYLLEFPFYSILKMPKEELLDGKKDNFNNIITVKTLYFKAIKFLSKFVEYWITENTNWSNWNKLLNHCIKIVEMGSTDEKILAGHLIHKIFKKYVSLNRFSSFRLQWIETTVKILLKEAIQLEKFQSMFFEKIIDIYAVCSNIIEVMLLLIEVKNDVINQLEVDFFFNFTSSLMNVLNLFKFLNFKFTKDNKNKPDLLLKKDFGNLELIMKNFIFIVGMYIKSTYIKLTVKFNQENKLYSEFRNFYFVLQEISYFTKSNATNITSNDNFINFVQKWINLLSFMNYKDSVAFVENSVNGKDIQELWGKSLFKKSCCLEHENW